MHVKGLLVLYQRNIVVKVPKQLSPTPGLLRKYRGIILLKTTRGRGTEHGTSAACTPLGIISHKYPYNPTMHVHIGSPSFSVKRCVAH
jgi:hypothetical protein